MFSRAAFNDLHSDISPPIINIPAFSPILQRRFPPMSVRFLFAAWAVIGFAGWAGAESWERFRGPDGAGIARNQNLPLEFDEAKNLVWKQAIPGIGNSSPVIWENQLFLQTASADGSARTLLCLDTKTGKTIWERTSQGAKATTHPKNTYASATPATDGKAVYIATWNGKNVFLSALTMKGEPIWEKDLGEFVSAHGPGASPVLYRNKVFYAFDSDKKSTFFAFDKTNGNPLWSEPRVAIDNSACYTAPRIVENGANGVELIVSNSTDITSYDPETGSRNWKWMWNWGSPKPSPLRLVAGTVQVGDTLVAFSGTSAGRQTVGLTLPKTAGAAPVQVWDNKNLKVFPYVPTPLERDGYIYFVNDRGTAGCFEAKSGKQVWFEQLQGREFTASPVMVDGKIYAASEEGEVFVFPAEPKFNLLGVSKIGDRVRASPAVADGRIFFRDSKQLYCFGKKN
jgi:outer membrane protein assembly factor BamB